MDETDRLSTIEEAVQPVLQSHGLDLVALDWQRQGRRFVLRLFVDKPGGATIGDCERFSREAGDVLDVSGVIPESYDLEVSTPGLDRLLRTDREFRWARGRVVRCWVSAPGERAEVLGRLLDVEVDHLTIETGSGPVVLPRTAVTKVRLQPDVPWPKKAP